MVFPKKTEPQKTVSRKAAKAQSFDSSSLLFLCAFAALREKYFSELSL